ncbi:MAG: hypothetical protein HPY80_00210 [Bacteroidales bacterium]|nr:hypothetical protein [Bacteroidales bacterium]
MKAITARKNQTVFDIALQELGSIEAVFDILAANSFLRPDKAIDEGQIIYIPSEIIKPSVVDYYKRNYIYPSTGNGDIIELTPEDMVNITQKLNYKLDNGPTSFYGVRIPNLKGDLTIQINYTIPDTETRLHLEQSLDGENYSIITGSFCQLDSLHSSYTYNLNGLLTNYVRVVIDVCNEGLIKEIIYRV